MSVALFMITQVRAQVMGQNELLEDALQMIQVVGLENPIFSQQMKKARGIVFLNETHPYASLRFNIETQQIEIFQGFTKGPELLASALVHESRHADVDFHVVCLTGPLKGIEGCDETLPTWGNWSEGGSYVYELAFQRKAIELKVPGYQKYVRQFIGNLHIRFAKKPSLETLDQWIGDEIMKENKAFIEQVRKMYP
jgi:hypothetical protein